MEAALEADHAKLLEAVKQRESALQVCPVTPSSHVHKCKRSARS